MFILIYLYTSIYIFRETEVDLSAAACAIIIVSSVKSPDYVKVRIYFVSEKDFIQNSNWVDSETRILK